MGDTFVSFFSLGGMIAYFSGLAVAVSWHYIKLRVRGRYRPINWTSLGFIVGVSAMVFIGMQNIQLATEVQRCQKEFNSSLKQRSLISLENDRLSQEQRHWLSKSDEAIGDLIKRVTSPVDPAIAALDRSDPRRLAWESGLVTTYNIRTATYRNEIIRIEKEQALLQRQREEHPLPEPACGAGK